MRVTEISLALKNQPGELSKVSELMGANAINIIAIHVEGHEDKGLLRFVANDPEKALNVLKGAGYSPITQEVLALEVPHHPGGLNAILKPLRDANVNVEYLYPCLGSGERTIIIFGVNDISSATATLKENWIHMYGEELYAMCA